MSGTESLLRSVPRRWRYAVIGGMLALPVTAFGYWQTGSELSLSPVLCGGLLAGYLAERRIGESHGVGIRTGLIGGSPVVWILFDVLSMASALAGPVWFVTGATLLTVVVVAAFGFGLAALFGTVGAKIGSWLARKQPGRSTSGSIG